MAQRALISVSDKTGLEGFARILASLGIESMLVDAGGDLRLGEPPPGRQGWNVELPGGETVVLSNVGVATSGDQFRFVELDGVRYTHVIDPRSGEGVRDAPTVSVVAPDATTADVLSSALTVLNAGDGQELVTSLDNVHARIVGAVRWTSTDFPRPPMRPVSGANR